MQSRFSLISVIALMLCDCRINFRLREDTRPATRKTDVRGEQYYATVHIEVFDVHASTRTCRHQRPRWQYPVLDS